jgi:hypothetical protein
MCAGAVWLRQRGRRALQLRRELRVPAGLPLCRRLRLRDQEVAEAFERELATNVSAALVERSSRILASSRDRHNPGQCSSRE